MSIKTVSTHHISHIIHIADLHILIGDPDKARIKAYDDVFEQFIVEITALQCVKENKALLIVAGDVFNYKYRCDTPGSKLFFKWFNKIANTLPCVIICGNHDFKQECPSYPDMVSAFVQPYQSGTFKYPIIHLEASGHYRYGNIGIGNFTGFFFGIDKIQNIRVPGVEY